MPEKNNSVALESDFIKVVRDSNSTKTYVIFSSVDIEPGKFMFWRVMSPIPGNKIFLNDSDNGWYVHGIPGLGRTALQAAASLLEIIRSTSPQEVIFLGPSMGGYGAMLYGAILSNELHDVKTRCLSFGGEFLLYGRETRSGSMGKKEQHKGYADIRPLLKQSNLSVTQVYGDTDLTDIFQASKTHDIENIKRYALRGGPHAVSTFIGQRFDLMGLIQRFGETGELPNLPWSNEFDHPEFGKELFLGHLALLDRDSKLASNHLQAACNMSPDNAIARHKLGIAQFDLGLYESALNNQNQAIQLSPKMDNAYFSRGLIFLKLEKQKLAIEEFEKCVLLNPRHIKSRTLLIESLILENRLEDCVQHVNAIKDRSPNNPKLKEFERLLGPLAIRSKTAV
ncbi:tetratricopeptide repeat protein [Pseudomonas sp. NPDC089428]|uniref:tetratricopeptide repeat protein n=1 Tax=Pseudomonas sp. NPDC089428 TaxID=3364467 RepID=UPI0037F60D4A